jgi:hypothetical protein
MFLRIGDTAINTEWIREIYFSPEKRIVHIVFISPDKYEREIRFVDEDHDRFMDWWGRKAEFYHA